MLPKLYNYSAETQKATGYVGYVKGPDYVVFVTYYGSFQFFRTNEDGSVRKETYEQYVPANLDKRTFPERDAAPCFHPDKIKPETAAEDRQPEPETAAPVERKPPEHGTPVFYYTGDDWFPALVTVNHEPDSETGTINLVVVTAEDVTEEVTSVLHFSNSNGEAPYWDFEISAEPSASGGEDED